MHILLIIIMLSLLCSCTEQPQQSESQLRLAAVHQQAKEHLIEAQQAITGEVIQHPGRNLQNIYRAHQLVIEARQVYRKAEVFGLEPQALSDFAQQLTELNSQLAQYALELMLELADRTLVLREKIQKIRDAESGVGNVSGKQSIKRLSRLYNEEVYKCCLKDIYTVIEVLHQQQPQTYSRIVQLGMHSTDEMVKILQNQDHEPDFRRRVNELKKQ